MLHSSRKVKTNRPSLFEFYGHYAKDLAKDFASKEPPEPNEPILRELEPQSNKKTCYNLLNIYESNRGNDLPKRKYFWGQLYGCSSCFNLHDTEFILSRKWIMRTDFLALNRKLNAVKISRHHFVVKIQHLKNGLCTVRITDLSTRGTFVNGRLIGKNETITLFDGDVISIIHPRAYLFRFKDFSNTPYRRRT